VSESKLQRTDGRESTASIEEDRLLRVDEAAKLLGLSVGGLYHLVSEKRVPVIKISSRCIRFSRAALLLWLDTLTQSAATSPGEHRLTSSNQSLQRTGNRGTQRIEEKSK
jgi:excisionase family DNA binding protein